MSLLSIVVPCFNEEETVEIFYSTLLKSISQMDLDFEVIFVNDGSRDYTLAKCLKLYQQDQEHVRIVDLSRNFGKEAALLAGLEKAIGDYIVVMDVDLQDPPEYIPLMYQTLKEKNLDVVGTRRVTRKGEPKIRSFFARKFYKLINRLIDIEIVDGARDFRMMTRQVVDSILQLQEYNRFSKGLFVWVGYDTEYLEYENIERVAGETKWSFWKLFRYAIDGIIEYSDMPLRMIAYFGSGMSMVMIIEMLVLLIMKLTGRMISQSTLVISIILLIGSLILLAIGIVAEYLAKTYSEVQQRPHYIVKNFYE